MLSPARSEPSIAPHPAKSASARAAKEALLGQRSVVIWVYGLSGSGKTTLASGLEQRLTQVGRASVLLDGDVMRAGLSKGLGFSDDARAENIRRAAEVAKLFLEAGVITICAFITPLRAHREIFRRLIRPEDLIEVYMSASLATCEQRDVKGLYAAAKQGTVPQFTGKDSAFEPPASSDNVLTIDSGKLSIDASLDAVLAAVTPRIARK